MRDINSKYSCSVLYICYIRLRLLLTNALQSVPFSSIPGEIVKSISW